MRALLRWSLRWSYSAIAAVFGMACITIFNQNIEEFSASMGWDSFLKDGWQIVTNLGWESWIVYGFFFFAGGSLTLWMDYWIRRWTERQATEARAELLNARTLLEWDAKGNMLPPSALDNTHHVYAQPHIDTVLIMMGFITPIPDGHILVSSNIKGLKWMDCHMSDRHAVVRADGKLKDGFIHIEIVPPSAAFDRRQQQGVWQEATFLKNADTLQPAEE